MTTMSRFIRFGTTLINLHHVRKIDYTTSLNNKKHYVTIHQGNEGPGGGFMFFTSPSIVDRWIFDTKEEAINFLNQVDTVINKFKSPND